MVQISHEGKGGSAGLGRFVRAAATLASLATLSTLTACDAGRDLSPPIISARVERPRAALLGGDVVAVAYDELDVRDGVQSDRRLRTQRLSTSTGNIEASASFNAYNSDDERADSPVAMSAGADGFAISLVAGSIGTGGVTTHPPQGCVHALAGAITCTTLHNEWTRGVAAVHAGNGQATVVYGSNVGYAQRSFNLASGWGPSLPGPVLPFDSQAADDRSLVRWRDGSMFFAGFDDRAGTPAKAMAVHYEPASAAWQPAERLGDAEAPAQLALHPDAPSASPVAVWRPPTGGIHTSTWQAGSGWSAAAPVPGSSPAADRPALAMWPNGDVIVLWVAGPATARAVVAARRVGGVWQAPENVGPTSGTPGRIALGVDRFGNAVVLWPNAGTLMSASYIAGQGWDGATAVGSLANINGSADLDLAMEPGGRAVAVWAEPEPGGQPGSHLALAEVGPSVLRMQALRPTFGGEAIAVTVTLATPPTQATTLTLTSTLPATLLTLPASLPVAANQGQVTFDVPTAAVNSFIDGRIEAVLGRSAASQPVTLMPEPTGLAMQVAPGSVRGGETATLTLQVTPTYPVSLAVDLSSSLALAPVPARLNTDPVTSSASVVVSTATNFATQTAVFSARLRGLVASTSLQVNPSAVGQVPLNISLQGQGSVSSTPAGIVCPSACSALFPPATAVALNALPASGFRLLGWEGDADCSDGLLTLAGARNCSAMFTPSPPPYPDGVGWTALGAALVVRNFVNPAPALALDINAPVVAYVQANSAGAAPQLFVRRLAVDSYEILGTAALNRDPTQGASEPAIVTSNSGLPYVAWVEGTGARQNLFVSRLSLGAGLTWVSVGAANVALNYAAGSRASSPSIRLDAELRPMVAWIEDGAVKFKRFDGTAWVQAPGGQGPVSAGADRVRLSSYSALVGVADPVIAWTQGSGLTRALKVVRDFAFTPLGTQVNPASLRSLSEFAVLAENGGAIVTWGDGGDAVLPFTLRSQRWDGTAWVNVSGVVVNNNPNRLVALAMAHNDLSVAYVFASLTGADIATLGVSHLNPQGGWLGTTTSLQNTRDGNIGPLALERVGASPVLVIVQRNASNEYSWRVMRYY